MTRREPENSTAKQGISQTEIFITNGKLCSIRIWLISSSSHRNLENTEKEAFIAKFPFKGVQFSAKRHIETYSIIYHSQKLQFNAQFLLRYRQNRQNTFARSSLWPFSFDVFSFWSSRLEPRTWNWLLQNQTRICRCGKSVLICVTQH